MLGLAGCAIGHAAAEEAHPPVGRFVTAEGLSIHHTDEGDGPPIVLIHGASGNLRDMTFSLSGRMVAQGFRVIAFDRPGHGYSDRPAERGWDPAVQARVLRAALAEIGVERAVIAGHSWGGAVATAWALQSPESAAAVASLAGATHPWGGDAGFLYSVGANPWLSPLARTAARLMVDEDDPTDVLNRIFAPDAIPDGYADYVGVSLALRPDTFRWNCEDLDNLNACVGELAPRYPSLTMPVLAMHGTADDTVAASIHAEQLVKDAPDARLALLDGVGHMPHHAAEDVVVARLSELARAAA